MGLIATTHAQIISAVPTCMKMNMASGEEIFSPFVPLSEVKNTKEKFVRTIGYAKNLEAASELLTIEYNGHMTLVDIRYIHPFTYKPDVLFQFVGELRREQVGDNTNIVLRAQVYRNMDGLDPELYHKVQAIRNHN